MMLPQFGSGGLQNCKYILGFPRILCFQGLHLKSGPGIKWVHLFSSKDIIIIALGALPAQISAEISDPRSSVWGGGLDPVWSPGKLPVPAGQRVCSLSPWKWSELSNLPSFQIFQFTMDLIKAKTHSYTHPRVFGFCFLKGVLRISVISQGTTIHLDSDLLQGTTERRLQGRGFPLCPVTAWHSCSRAWRFVSRCTAQNFQKETLFFSSFAHSGTLFALLHSLPLLRRDFSWNE